MAAAAGGEGELDGDGRELSYSNLWKNPTWTTMAVFLDISVRRGVADGRDDDEDAATAARQCLSGKKAAQKEEQKGVRVARGIRGDLIQPQGIVDVRHGDNRRCGRRARTASAMACLLLCTEKGEGLGWAGLCTVAMGYKCTVQFFYFFSSVFVFC